ncbi:MAG: hypothetical protein JWN51_535 [Phycisphaerales bacterium]|nr:hypothetical protein [Phycisphaerales bacterium]
MGSRRGREFSKNVCHHHSRSGGINDNAGWGVAFRRPDMKPADLLKKISQAEAQARARNELP